MPLLGKIGETITSFIGITTKGQTNKAGGLPISLPTDQVGTAASPSTDILSVQPRGPLYTLDTSGATNLQNAATTTVNGTPLDVSQMAGLGLFVTITGGTATITWEYSNDGGTTWVALPVTDATLGTQVLTSTATSNLWVTTAGRILLVRARISAISGATVTVKGHAVTMSPMGQNPVAAYGKNSATGDTALLLSPAGRIYLAGSTDAALTGTTATTITNTSDSGGRILGVGQYGNNSSTFDAWRNNVESTVLSSASRSATTNSTAQTNYNGRGVSLIINVTVAPAIETLTLAIQVQDSISGTWISIQTGAAMTGTGTTRLVVYPGIGSVANLAFSDILARTWRVAITHSASGSWTYSVSAVTIL